MINGKNIGLSLFICGIILLCAYGVYIGLNDILTAFDVLTGFFAGMIFLGLVILVASILMEQRRDTLKMREKLREEDLRP
jgi:uncharacterized membrane protein